MKPLTKAVRSAHTEGKQWTKHLYKFLLNYRTTPHSTTGYAPPTLLFNRAVCNKLPQITPPKSSANQQVKENDQKAKSKMKEMPMQGELRAKPLNLEIGDVVQVRQRKRNKFTIRFDPRPFEVVRKKGTMVTACRDGRYITRNISQFKVIDQSRAPRTTTILTMIT